MMDNSSAIKTERNKHRIDLCDLHESSYIPRWLLLRSGSHLRLKCEELNQPEIVDKYPVFSCQIQENFE